MRPFFSIITPTLQRESLIKTCASIDAQTFREFEHLIQIDCQNIDESLFQRTDQPWRWSSRCDVPHRNGGNTCRGIALGYSAGEYVFFLDDDNYLADDRVLEDVWMALCEAGKPDWALFPIERLGQRFYTDPPRSCHVDTMNFVLRSDIAFWPDTDAYGTDGILVDDLMARGIPYAAFPDFRPIAVIPKISFCQ